MLLSCQPHENIKAGQNSEKLLFKSCMMDQKEQFYELLEKLIFIFRQEEEEQVHHHPRGLQEDPGMSATQERESLCWRS